MKIRVIIILVLIFCGSIISQPYEWSEPINLTNMDWDLSFQQDLFIDKNDSLHIAWVHKERFEGTMSLYSCSGLDNTWSSPIRLTDSAVIYAPKIVTNNFGTTFIAYDHEIGEYSRNFIVTKENNVWQSPIQLSEDSLGWGFNVEMVIDNNNTIYVFYSNFSGIYWRNYSDNKWSDVDSIITFPPALTALSEPLAVVDANNDIHLIFKYYDEIVKTTILYYKKYNGINWTEKYSISIIDSLGGPRDYSIAIDSNNNPHVVYTQLNKIWDPGIILFYTKKKNNNWTIPDNITSENDGEVFRPKIKINPTNNEPLIIAIIDTNDTHINETNAYFIYQRNKNWVIEDILKDYPNIIAGHFDFDFDNKKDIHYVFSRKDLSPPQLNDLYYTKGTLITDINENNYSNKNQLKLEVYPNPFNTGIKINYELPISENVTITIYDSLGREIKTIVNERKPKGMYEATFNAKNLSSGVYLIKIETGKHHKTIKVSLIK